MINRYQMFANMLVHASTWPPEDLTSLAHIITTSRWLKPEEKRALLECLAELKEGDKPSTKTELEPS